ncbi:MAG: hypothetical protein ACHP7N_17725 [Caulobacterales bacterium]
MSETPAETYETLLRRAHDDTAVLAFWLGGSRGMGRPTEHSDYDCCFIVTEEAYEPFCAELGLSGSFQGDWRPKVDLKVMTFPMFEAHAAWNSDERGYRYTFAHMRAQVDKTGRAQPMIDAKARVPEGEIEPFVAASLDHALNQLYRAVKCLRDGDKDASRLEAAEGVTPFIDALFAVHGGRLRPYYKYLRWELAQHPLERAPFAPEALMALLTGLVAPEGVFALQRLMAKTQPLFRSFGHDATYDGWGRALDFMLNYPRPAADLRAKP